jgi:hypothetical protein
MSSEVVRPTIYTRLSLGFICWLGGAVHVASQPGYGFWDGVVWMYYVGRYIATHFAQLS